MDEDRSDHYQKRQKGITLSLKRNFTWMLGSRISIILATLFTGALINRTLGPSGRGVFAEIQTWVALFIVIFGLSMESGIYHFANKKRYSYDDRSRLTTVFIMTFICAVLATITLTLCVKYWPEGFSSSAIAYIILLDILLITSMLSVNLRVLLESLGSIRFSAMVGFVQALVNIMVIGYGYFFRIMDIRFVVTRLIIIQVISLVVLFIIFLSTGLNFGRFSMGMSKGIIAAGFKQHIGTVSTFIYTKVNQLIVFRYCGEREAGIFAVALTLAFALMFIPETFRIVLYPRVIHSDDDYAVTVRSMRLGFYAWGGLAILFILLARPILLMYGGDRFLPSVNAFRILMIAVWFLPLSSLLAPYYVKKGAFGIASFSAVLLGVISIGINLFLVQRYMSVGAAIATALTCFIGFCMVILFFYYLSKRNPLVVFKPDFKNEINYIRNLYSRRMR